MVFDPKLEVVSGEEHRLFLEETYRYAWCSSGDIRTKVGALIVSPDLKERLVYGANHFPSGLEVTAANLADKDWKYKHIIHAELAAISKAAREGKSTERGRMYMPWVPCTPCATAVVDAGIRRLIGHKAMIEKTPERWWESTADAIELLQKCGVELFMYDGEIGSVRGLFDGQEWNP